METSHIINSPAPIIKLQNYCDGYNVLIKRDDLLHPLISGNKWRKLKYNIQEAVSMGKSQLVTKGGAYSNHIAAVAVAGKLFGLRTTGIIRGEQPSNYGFTLRLARSTGMTLKFLSRSTYTDWDFGEDFENFHDSYFVPEGGTNELAFQGCAELVTEIGSEIDLPNTVLCLAAGTGGTTAGILKASPASTQIVSFSALKGTWLKQKILNLAGQKSDILTVTDEFCFGGYAKADEKLIRFINDFYDQYGIPLDPVYTGKMMFGIKEMCRRKQFLQTKTILAVHTGGLQGAFGFAELGYKINWVNAPGCAESGSILSTIESLV